MFKTMILGTGIRLASAFKGLSGMLTRDKAEKAVYAPSNRSGEVVVKIDPVRSRKLAHSKNRTQMKNWHKWKRG